MIRTKEWKYINRYSYGPYELYHLVTDPDEKINLVDEDRFRCTIENLKSKSDKCFLNYVKPSVDGGKEAVYGKGQIAFDKELCCQNK